MQKLWLFACWENVQLFLVYVSYHDQIYKDMQTDPRSVLYCMSLGFPAQRVITLNDSVLLLIECCSNSNIALYLALGSFLKNWNFGLLKKKIHLIMGIEFGSYWMAGKHCWKRRKSQPAFSPCYAVFLKNPIFEVCCLISVHYFDDGYVEKQPVPWKEYCAKNW